MRFFKNCADIAKFVRLGAIFGQLREIAPLRNIRGPEQSRVLHIHDKKRRTPSSFF